MIHAASLVLAVGLSLQPAEPVQPSPPAGTPAATPADRAAPPFGERWTTRVDPRLMGQALGFYEARLALLTRIAREFPELANAANAARSRLAAHYGPAAAAVEQELARRDASFREDWARFKREQLQQQTDKAPLTAESARAGLESGGFAPERQMLRHMAMLNAWHPAFRANHAAEIEQGFGRKVGIGLPADDANWLAVPVPSSWASITPKDAPPTAFMLAGNVGLGPAVVRIETHPYDGPAEPSPAELLSLLGRLSTTGEGEKVIGTETARVAGDLTAVRTIEATKTVAEGRTAYSRGTLSVFVRGKVAIVVYMSVFDDVYADETAPTADQVLRTQESHRAVFDWMRAGMVIEPKPARPAGEPARP
ncbi:MAG: hypothetical protein JNJ48_03390 [Phycisphaerae bacterium]|nr:hypothetical protein [Phycisphaerae bacterium]